MLKTQTKQIQEDIKRVKKYLNETNQEKLHEQRCIDDLHLHEKNAQLLIKKLKDEKDVRSFSFSSKYLFRLF
jgi:hypothetical protein